MKNYKESNVFLLPTEGLSNIQKSNINCRLIQSNSTHIREYTTPQHLYITSDDEIKEGDWCIDQDNNLFQKENNGMSNNADYFGSMKKIIATTDTSLKRAVPQFQLGEHFNDYYPLPQPSKQFISNYIFKYNKDEIVRKILVECNDPVCKCSTFEKISECPYNNGDDCRAPNPNKDFYGLSAKVNPTDNTITIKLAKEIWERNEVIELINNFHGHSYGGINDSTKDEWIRNNIL